MKTRSIERLLLCGLTAITLVGLETCTARATNLMINGDVSNNETGWQRWAAYGSNSVQFLVATNDPTTPKSPAFPGGKALTAYLPAGQNASAGWYQSVPVAVGTTCILSQVEWAGYLGSGANTSWAEVDLFSVSAGTSASAIIARINTVPNGRVDIFLKKSTYGFMNYDGNPWDWQSALTSVSTDGSGWAANGYGNDGIVVSQGNIIVALKLGWNMGSTTCPGIWTAWDNLVLETYPPAVTAPVFSQVVPQPDGSVILNGTSGPANQSYTLWASDTVDLPFASWSQITSGSFDGSGNFSYPDTDAINHTVRYYRLSIP